jgi:hypothetical protein
MQRKIYVPLNRYETASRAGSVLQFAAGAARVGVQHVLAVSAQAAERPGVIRLLVTLSDDAPRAVQTSMRRTVGPSPWFSATGPKCRVSEVRRPRIAPASAVACVTPSGENIRVGVLLGADDREASVVLDRAQAKAYAESILAMCAGPRTRRVVVEGSPVPYHDVSVSADGRVWTLQPAVCPAGDCPCGRVRAGCEYHDPTLQPR